MSSWTPFEFAIALTFAAFGIMLATTLAIAVSAPLYTISDWLDRRLQAWWKSEKPQ